MKAQGYECVERLRTTDVDNAIYSDCQSESGCISDNI